MTQLQIGLGGKGYSQVDEHRLIEPGTDGWYICSVQWKECRVGPFMTSMEAHAAYNSFRERPNPYQLGFVGANTVLYEHVVVTHPERVWVGDRTRIDSFVKLEGGLGMRIGNYVHIASFSHIGLGGGATILEDETGFSSGSRVVSGSNMPDALARSIAAKSERIRVERGKTVIKARAILYANAVVLPNVTVGVRGVVGAGAVVTKDIPDNEIWAGVPAKKIGTAEVL